MQKRDRDEIRRLWTRYGSRVEINSRLNYGSLGYNFLFIALYNDFPFKSSTGGVRIILKKNFLPMRFDSRSFAALFVQYSTVIV